MDCPRTPPFAFILLFLYSITIYNTTAVVPLHYKRGVYVDNCRYMTDVPACRTKIANIEIYPLDWQSYCILIQTKNCFGRIKHLELIGPRKTIVLYTFCMD
jgi:hypothetical protein